MNFEKISFENLIQFSDPIELNDHLINMDESEKMIDLQNYILNLKNEDLENCTSKLNNLTKDDIDFLFRHIFFCCGIRPKKINIYLYFIQYIISLIPETKEYFWYYCTMESEDSLFLDLHIEQLYILYLAKKLNIVSKKEIVEFLKERKAKSYGHPVYFFGYFAIFAPLIEELEPQLFLECEKEFLKYCHSSNSPISLMGLDSKWNFLKENNWENHQKSIELGHSPSSLAIIIDNDDVNTLELIYARNENIINDHIEPSIFSHNHFIQSHPSIFQYSAFKSSIKCFKFLLLNGADPNEVANNDFSIIHFAIAGGNYEIIRILEQKQINFDGSLQIACYFYQNEIFSWLYNSKFPNLFQYSWGYGTVLHQAAKSNNIEKALLCMKIMKEKSLSYDSFLHLDVPTPLQLCAISNNVEVMQILLNNNIEPNEKCDILGETMPIHSAVQNGSLNVLKVLLKQPNILVNERDDIGFTPIMIASKMGFLDIIKELLNYPGIDYTIKDQAQRTILHHALQFGHIEICKLLLSLPDLDINAPSI